MQALNDEINTKIAEVYRQRRRQAERSGILRRDDIHRRYPEIKALEQKVQVKGTSYLVAVGKDASKGQALDGTVEAVKESKLALEKVRQELADLLQLQGISSDYAAPQWHCELCRDTGIIGHEPCSCYQELYRRELERIIPSAAIPEVSLANYGLTIFPEEPVPVGAKMIQPREYMATIRDIARAYCGHFSELKDRNMFFSGQPGSGKTWLLSGIAHDINAQGKTVLMLSADYFFDLLAEIRMLKYSFRPEPDRYARSEMIAEAIRDCDLLIIDDLGRERQDDNSYMDLLQLLDSRIRDKAHMIIASNQDIDYLQRKYDGRVAGRIAGNFLSYSLLPIDLRYMQAKRLLE